MVSIPNWSSFRNYVSSVNLQTSAELKKKSENGTIATALRQGYLVHLTETYLEQCLEEQESNKCLCLSDEVKGKQESKKLHDIIVLRLPACHIRTIYSLSLCTNLRICLLGDNYINRIDALDSCTQLFELDLHSNEVM